jgi:predicted acyl esterase
MRALRKLIPMLGCLFLLFVTGQTSVVVAQVSLSGRVIEEGTEKPLQGIQVGAARWFKLGKLTWKERVQPERTATTGENGDFTFTIPAHAPGMNKVVVFTCGEDRGNLIFKDAPFEGRVPQAKDFEQPGVVAIDLTRDATGVIFTLPETPDFRHNVMVPMRDGTRLATNIFLPQGEGPWPAILSRTPYGKSDKIPTGQLQNGFAVVRQDFRGRFGSEGKDDMPFINDGWGELQDGYDTIEWIAEQPWCNGKVGTAGGSAGGITQVMTAGVAPPHLTCQLIAVAFGSMYHHAAYQGGAFRKALVEGWLQNHEFSPHCLEKVLAHPSYDQLWKQVDANNRSEHIQAPGFFTGGWYDVFCQGTIDAFMWRQCEGGKGARGKQKLIMGAWVHGRKQKLGEFDLPRHALRSPLETRGGGWFEYWLKDEDNGIMDEAPVHYYVMGAFGEPGAPGHEWRSSDVWPIPSQPTPFYLHGDGTLSRAKPENQDKLRSYDYDPTKPVPTLGGCNLVLDKGPYDQQPVESRPDVLLYTSEPLEQPLEVTGRIKAYLWASSSCKDTDFTVKLTDVYPDGKSVLIQDGIIRARFRNSFEREELMTPGNIYRFEIDLWSTSIVFNTGHRIRVAVSSSNAPRFEPNPNTGDPFRANSNTIVATNTIYHDGKHPSHILLPVVQR